MSTEPVARLARRRCPRSGCPGTPRRACPPPPTRRREPDAAEAEVSPAATRLAQRVAVRDIGASCRDGRHPATAMFDGQKFGRRRASSALARLPSPTRLSSLSLDVGPSVRQVTSSVGHLDARGRRHRPA